MMSTKSIAMWKTLPNNADWDCFKTPILQEILRIQKKHQVEHCVFLEVIHLFQSVGCVRNKLHFRSSSESEIISLDTGLRWDGIHALDLWDLIFAVLGNTNQSHEEQGDLLLHNREVRSPRHTIRKRKQSQRVIDDLGNVDFIPSNVNSSHQEASLYVF